MYRDTLSKKNREVESDQILFSRMCGQEFVEKEKREENVFLYVC